MLEHIRLQNFRSYTDASFTFSPDVTIIVGPNGSGKTNLLEAVLMVARGASYRAKDTELVRFGAPWARLDARAPEMSRTVRLEKQDATIKKSFEINEQQFQRLSPQKIIPVVLFEPNHLSLLSGSPELRRNFLDDILEQTTPGYGSFRRQYKRVLAQRNALLKKGVAIAAPQLFVWNLRLSELGGKLARERQKLVEHINEAATDTYRNLSDAPADVALAYISSITLDQYETSLLRLLETNVERDCLLGYTGAGPHRDDMLVHLNGWKAEETASRGELRSLVLMLKIVELMLLQQSKQITPLLLLDDVFSELDSRRRQALTKHLRPYQTFITTTDADAIAKHFVEARNLITLTRPGAE